MLIKRILRGLSFRCSFHSMSGAKFESIGTHDGTFHCDEALGCYLLRILNGNAKIVRSRDSSVLDKCDIVIDVGGVYDPEKLRFDHHQRGFEHTTNSLKGLPFHIKLSSAGLVYCHFGEEIIRKILGQDEDALSHIYQEVYRSFIREIDAIDNGVEMFDGPPLYAINTNLSKRVGFFNKRWNADGFDEEAAFKQAMELAGSEFVETVKYIHDVWWPARKIVKESLDSRHEVDPCGEIVLLKTYVPFIEHLLELEKELNIDGTIKYVIYSDRSSYRIRAVPVSASSFISRIPLLKKWQGLRNQDLDASGCPTGAVFVHNSGFIGGHSSLAGAIAMALQSLQHSQ